MKSLRFAMAVLLASATGAAAAAVQVQFLEPGKYRDATPDSFNTGARETAPTLQQLKKHIEKLGNRYIPADETLKVTILDVDLAGEVRPLGNPPHDIRLMNGLYWPSIRLRYEIEKNGQIASRGEETVSDPSYLQQINPYDNGDPLRHERFMLDEWFAKKFGKR